MSDLTVGLMTGTSLDGVDAVLVRHHEGRAPQILGAVSLAYPPALRDQVLQLCRDQGGSFSAIGRIDVELARLCAVAVKQLLAETGVAAESVRAIGSHGQTVHHEPLGDARFTLQLGDPNTLAVATGITVVADFRRRDMALGGQGAPLAPGLHDQVFRHPSRVRIVLNAGGIANISVLVPGQPCIGYDTGPANILMDAWLQARTGQSFDRDGALAASGALQPALLAAMRTDPYFAFPPPKSTGREHFNLAWVQAHLNGLDRPPGDADVLRTLLELTAGTVADAIGRHATQGELLVAGGGARNPALLERLRACLPAWQVDTTAAAGVLPEHVESLAFAVFAQRTMDGLPANLPSVTGASRPCLLGGIYPP